VPGGEAEREQVADALTSLQAVHSAMTAVLEKVLKLSKLIGRVSLMPCRARLAARSTARRL
jgi:hypothetical protein